MDQRQRPPDHGVLEPAEPAALVARQPLQVDAQRLDEQELRQPGQDDEVARRPAPMLRRREAKRAFHPGTRGRVAQVERECLGQRREQRVERRIAAEEAADEPCHLASAAGVDPGQPAIRGRLHQFVCQHRLDVERTAQPVARIARQQHGAARSQFEDVAAVIEADQHAALQHAVVGEQVPGRDEERLAVLRSDLGPDAPRRRELRLEEHAARQLDGAQDVRQCIHVRLARTGGSVMYSGAAVIQAGGRVA